MLLTLAVFVFATVGVKIVLGFAAVYLLLPDDRRCPACDGETLALAPVPGLRLLSRISRVHRRWCIACGRSTLARSGRQVTIWVGPKEQVRAEQAG